MTLRAALYARFSTDNQSAASIAELLSDWNGRDELTRKLLHVRVWRLRKLMGRAAIENSWGGGYRLTPAAADRVARLLLLAEGRAA